MGCTLEAAGQVGDLLGGLSAVVGLGFAFFSVGRWRKERLAERRAEAAARAVLAAADLEHALIAWTSGVFIPLRQARDTGGSVDVPLLEQAHSNGRRETADTYAEFRRAMATVSLYLGMDAASSLLGQVVLARRDVGNASWSILTSARGNPTLEAAHLEKLGDALEKVRRSATAALDALRTRLAPIARYSTSLVGTEQPGPSTRRTAR